MTFMKIDERYPCVYSVGYIYRIMKTFQCTANGAHGMTGPLVVVAAGLDSLIGGEHAQTHDHHSMGTTALEIRQSIRCAWLKNVQVLFESTFILISLIYQ